MGAVMSTMKGPTARLIGRHFLETLSVAERAEVATTSQMLVGNLMDKAERFIDPSMPTGSVPPPINLTALSMDAQDRLIQEELQAQRNAEAAGKQQFEAEQAYKRAAKAAADRDAPLTPTQTAMDTGPNARSSPTPAVAPADKAVAKGKPTDAPVMPVGSKTVANDEGDSEHVMGSHAEETHIGASIVNHIRRNPVIPAGTKYDRKSHSKHYRAEACSIMSHLNLLDDPSEWTPEQREMDAVNRQKAMRILSKIVYAMEVDKDGPHHAELVEGMRALPLILEKKRIEMNTRRRASKPKKTASKPKSKPKKAASKPKSKPKKAASKPKPRDKSKPKKKKPQDKPATKSEKRDKSKATQAQHDAPKDKTAPKKGPGITVKQGKVTIRKDDGSKTTVRTGTDGTRTITHGTSSGRGKGERAASATKGPGITVKRNKTTVRRDDGSKTTVRTGADGTKTIIHGTSSTHKAKPSPVSDTPSPSHKQPKPDKPGAQTKHEQRLSQQPVKADKRESRPDHSRTKTDKSDRDRLVQDRKDLGRREKNLREDRAQLDRARRDQATTGTTKPRSTQRMAYDALKRRVASVRSGGGSGATQSRPSVTSMNPSVMRGGGAVPSHSQGQKQQQDYSDQGQLGDDDGLYDGDRPRYRDESTINAHLYAHGDESFTDDDDDTLGA